MVKWLMCLISIWYTMDDGSIPLQVICFILYFIVFRRTSNYHPESHLSFGRGFVKWRVISHWLFNKSPTGTGGLLPSLSVALTFCHPHSLPPSLAVTHRREGLPRHMSPTRFTTHKGEKERREGEENK